MTGLSVRTMTRRHSAPAFAFKDALQVVLPGWDISLAFVGAARAKAFNIKLRGKSYVPNVLSYKSGLPDEALAKSGEVVICLEVAKKQAPDYGMSYPEFVGFLFIHALLHLKGMPHGAKMEKEERAVLARVLPNTHGQKNRNRHRHRDVPDKSRRHRRG